MSSIIINGMICIALSARVWGIPGLGGGGGRASEWAYVAHLITIAEGLSDAFSKHQSCQTISHILLKVQFVHCHNFFKSNTWRGGGSPFPSAPFSSPHTLDEPRFLIP